MTRFRVKAYFMHEHEEEAAKKAAAEAVIESPEWTAGYVMGIVEESSIKALREKGLIVTPIERITKLAPGGNVLAGADEIRTLAGLIITRFGAPTRSFSAAPVETDSSVPNAVAAAPPKSKILSADRRKAQYYVVRFHGPLTLARKAALRKLRIKPTERVTPNRYTVHLTPTQVKQAAALEFVDWLRLYDATDTLKARETTPADLEPSLELLAGGGITPPLPTLLGTITTTQRRKPSRMCVFALRVHRGADLKTVLRWLQRRKIKPLWSSKDQLRVALRNPSRELTALAKLPEVASVEELRAARPLDEFAQRILGIPALRQGAPETHLRGAGELIGIADTGLDVTHPDFKRRIHGIVALGRKRDATDPEGHGTHVAGCAAGDGSASDGAVVGAAPAAKIFFQSILDAQGGLGGLPPDLGKLFKQSYAQGVRIHNNSWGAFAFANYAATSLQVDRFVYANPDMLIVIAAGNDGIGIARGTDGLMNSTAGFVDWPSVAAPATAKNGLTVGASRSSRTEHGYSTLKWGVAWADRYPNNPIAAETVSGDEESLAAFSSRGPSDDQRIKPDVVAPGTDIAATRSKDAPLHKFWGAYPNNDQYGFMGGTSMAAPYVSGCAALVREWYRRERKYSKPSAALVKATLINGTCRIKGRDAQAPPKGNPNFHQGFGRINLATTVPNPGQAKLALAYVDTWMKTTAALAETGARHRYGVEVAAGTPLRLCLAWTDPPARGLQNSLVLLADDGAKGKWVGNSTAAATLRVSGAFADPNNNVQIVRIEAPQRGLYTIVITAANLLDPPQHYALVVTGDLQSALRPQ